MEVKVISEIKKLDEFKENFEILLTRSEHSEIFYTWDWMDTFLKHMCNPQVELFVILVFQNDKLIGVAPLNIEKRKIGLITVRVIHPIVNKTADYCDFYFDRSYNYYELLKKIFNEIFKNKNKWDYMQLSNFNTRSRNTYLIKEIIESQFNTKCFYEQSVMSPYLEYNQMSTKVNKRQIKDIERRERNLTKSHKVEYFINQKFDREIWSEFINLHKERWNKSVLNNKSYINFYENLIPMLERKQQLEFSYIKLDDSIAAVHFGFKTEKKVYYYIPIYSSKYSNIGVGYILLKHIVEHYMDKKKEFDFLRGNEKYKFDWTDTVHMNYNFYVANDNRLGFYIKSYVKLNLYAKNSSFLRKLLKK